MQDGIKGPARPRARLVRPPRRLDQVERWGHPGMQGKEEGSTRCHQEVNSSQAMMSSEGWVRGLGNQIDYICSQRWKSPTQSAKIRLGADCGSDHELLIAKFRLKLKKIGKTTKPFRLNLNEIPYDYIVEVTNRFKRLDLIECLKNYGWRFMTLYRRQGSRPSPRKRNAKRENGCLRRPYK